MKNVAHTVVNWKCTHALLGGFEIILKYTKIHPSNNGIPESRRPNDLRLMSSWYTVSFMLGMKKNVTGTDTHNNHVEYVVQLENKDTNWLILRKRSTMFLRPLKKTHGLKMWWRLEKSELPVSTDKGLLIAAYLMVWIRELVTIDTCPTPTKHELVLDVWFIWIWIRCSEQLCTV